MKQVSAIDVNEAPFGIFAFGSSNEISGNRFFNVVVPGDPPSTSTAAPARNPVR